MENDVKITVEELEPVQRWLTLRLAHCREISENCEDAKLQDLCDFLYMELQIVGTMSDSMRGWGRQ